MTLYKILTADVLALLMLWTCAYAAPEPGKRLAVQRTRLLRELYEVHELSGQQREELGRIFASSKHISQGNPEVTVHPVTPEQCRERLRREKRAYENEQFRRICGAKYMAPLYDPNVEEPAGAGACIDQFEFPNIPCSYPVVWVRTREAALICRAVGKRLCDAHEWEGACEGKLEAPDYRFDLAAGKGPSGGVSAMRKAHNRFRAAAKAWAYGVEYRAGICAASSRKSSTCLGGGWADCGSNTFPTGFFPECRSVLDVYDLHGNAAEHMNLPLKEEQMASRGSLELGHTEMKGSWFIFDSYRAHEDWCRWRAPYWHGTRVMTPSSHHNYHLGFRCCKSLSRNH